MDPFLFVPLWRGRCVWGGSLASAPEPVLEPVQPSLIGWYDASAPETLTLGADNVVQQLGNRAGGRMPLHAVPEGGPTYMASSPVTGGRPALHWPDEESERGLWLGVDAPVTDVFVVLAYRDGEADRFAGFNTFVTDVAGMTGSSFNRVMGAANSSGLHSSSVSAGSTFSVNGVDVPAGDALLPLPLSVLHIKNDAGFPITAFGSKNGNVARSWRGPMCEVLAYSEPLTGEQISENIAYLRQKWGMAPVQNAAPVLPQLTGAPYAFPQNPVASHTRVGNDHGIAALTLFDGRGDNAGTVELRVGGEIVPLGALEDHDDFHPLYSGLYRFNLQVATPTEYTWSVDGQLRAAGTLFPNTAELTAFDTEPAISPAWGYVGDEFALTSQQGEHTETEVISGGAAVADAGGTIVADQAGSLVLVSRVSDPDRVMADNVETAVAYVLDRPVALAARFGDQDQVGQAGLDTNFVTGGPLSRGTYAGAWGEFVVDAEGVMTPSAPLVAGAHQIGGIDFEIVAGVRTVANAVELDAALDSFGISGGVIELRNGHYGYLQRPGYGFALTAPLTVRSSDPANQAHFSGALLDAAGSVDQQITLNQVQIFTGYDEPRLNNPGLTWAGGGDVVAQIDADTARNIIFDRCGIRSDFLPAYDARLHGVPWRVAKMRHQVRGRFKVIRAIDGEDVRDLSVNNSRFSDLGGCVWLSGSRIRIFNNDVFDYWLDPFNIYAPSSGVWILGNLVFNQMGDWIHPDFLQMYDKRLPRRGILRLTVARNVMLLGDKSARLVNEEDGVAFPQQQGILAQQLSEEMGDSATWLIENNLFQCTGQNLTLTTVRGATVRHNTIVSPFVAGQNLRPGTINIRASGLQDSVIKDNAAGFAWYAPTTGDAGGNEIVNNAGLSSIDVNDYLEAFQGDNFNIEDVTTPEQALRRFLMRPGGPLDTDKTGTYTDGDLGVMGTTLSNGRVDFTQRPYVENVIPPNPAQRIVDSDIVFTNGTGETVAAPYAAGAGENRVVLVTVAAFEPEKAVSSVALSWGGASGQQIAFEGSSVEFSATFMFREADFPVDGTGDLIAMLDGVSETVSLSAVTVRNVDQIAAANVVSAPRHSATITVGENALVLAIANSSTSSSLSFTGATNLADSRHGSTAAVAWGSAYAQAGDLEISHSGSSGRPSITLIELRRAS